MKFLSNLFKRKEGKYSKHENKKGASLAFVMMIGAALVIWVMCLLPLMTTTGTITYQTEEVLDDYLGSRSVIEFCKSELEQIVKSDTPYTFCVLKDENGKYAAYPKMDGATMSTVYQTHIDFSGTSDKEHRPLENANGMKVAAICAVTRNQTNANLFDITITTYHECDDGITYTALYKPSGSLKIHPEAYKQNEALPLSDFVLVDGKLGDNDVWNSTIDMAHRENFTESLLPWVLNNDRDDYANAGEYPAVFKHTAHAANVTGSGAEIGEEVTDGIMTTEEWFVPEAVSKDAPVKLPGHIWFDGKNIYIQGKEAASVLSGATVYYNGTASNSAPTKAGTYQISVDYPGTGAYVEGGLNILPAQGLTLRDFMTVNASEGSKNTITGSFGVTDVKRVDTLVNNKPTGEYTIKVTLTPAAENQTGLLYGCLSSDEGATTKWQESNVFEKLEPGKSYFFYVCRPAHIDTNGVLHPASEVVKAGMIYKPEYITTMEAGSYMITNAAATKYLANASSLVNLAKYDDGGGYVAASAVPATWSVSASGDNWKITQNGSSYLDMTGEANYTIETGSLGKYHGDKWHYCYKNTFNDKGYKNQTVSLTSNGSLTVTGTNDGSFILSKYLSTKVPFTDYYEIEYGFFESHYVPCGNSTTVDKTISTTLYLNLDSIDSKASATTSASSVKFAKIPVTTHPDVPAPSYNYTLSSYEMTFGTNAGDFVAQNLNPKHTLDKLYANSVVTSGNLNAGVYNLAVVTDLGKAGKRADTITESLLTINKVDLANELTFTTEKDKDDELAVTVTCANWHDNGGTRYFGYRKLNDAADSQMHWFPADDNDDDSFTFRLEYGEYIFAVRESGTTNYNGMTVEAAEATVIEPYWVDLTEDDGAYFYYTCSNGIVNWYAPTSKSIVPEPILPSRITMYYGVVDSSGNTIWSEEYPAYGTPNFYGVVIPNTPFDSADRILKINPPIGVKQNVENGKTYATSTITGSSLYFMGTDGSINTHGVDVHVKTDLLVLNSDISGNGNVYVKRYTENADNDYKDYVLFFNANKNAITRNGAVVFKARTFYKIPINTDLCNLTSDMTEKWELGTINTINKHLFQNNIYPEINLDIAYASSKQLYRILSGETIGWTNDGVMSGSDNSYDNSAYAVCAYVSRIQGNVSYTANRILIAGRKQTSTGYVYDLTIPGNATFNVRYFSVDTSTITQGNSNATCVIKNLGQDTNWLSWLSNNVLKISAFYSKTLQIDYEKHTTILNSSGNTVYQTPSRIYRYDNGKNLFAGQTSQDLMAVYSPSEISALSKFLTTTVRTVDRYISLSNPSGGNITWGSGGLGFEWRPYANYIYFDETISQITFNRVAFVGNAGVYVNTQESGYNETEYLGIFSIKSSENYSGTLLYFKNDVKVVTKTWIFVTITDEYTIPAGFYLVPAGGISLEDVAKNLSNYSVSEADLRAASVYIDPETGELGKAYVDTGIFDNESAGDGGFSGGGIQ